MRWYTFRLAEHYFWYTFSLAYAGGVGKTTLTTVMAEELANAGYSVLMLDLDSQTDLTDINLSQNEASNLFGLLTGQKALEEVVVELPGKGDKKIITGSARVDEIQTGVSNTLTLIKRSP